MSVTPATHRDTLSVDTGHSRYDILIGQDLLARAQTWEGLPLARRAVIITNHTIAPLWSDVLKRTLEARHERVTVLALPDGEAYKDWATLNTVFDHLLQTGCDRKCVLYALGGGVVGDMTGFAAGCFMRGVPFVQVPTTLLAQVDSSVGGKTAINHPLGKNMIGLFNQPLRVVCDLQTLRTLPARELAAGLAEVIKYGPIADPAFLDWIEANLDDLLAGRAEALTHAVRRSCEIKAQVVGQDEREDGLRAILNFGHTFGHAIEAALGYGAWLHGEAVACGMLMAADLSASLGHVPETFVHRLEQLLRRCRLPVKAPDLGAPTWMELMRRDKKAQAGEIRFVVLQALGQAMVQAVPDAHVAGVIERAVAR